ncbi:hypothetical protein Slin14017_G106100 [Septoria linicola]|nr:hypothetical protein Slin14017_G106100 [Septoria linicola]
MSSLCQICGARFYDKDLDRNPLAHFCIGLDGPAIVHEDAESSVPHTPELEKPKEIAAVSQQHSIQLPAPAHAKEDLIEIAKLRGEVDQLRAKLQEGHVSCP